MINNAREVRQVRAGGLWRAGGFILLLIGAAVLAGVLPLDAAPPGRYYVSIWLDKPNANATVEYTVQALAE